jgi:hypothetical protein
MALPTSNADFAAVAPRTAGQLITSADWNALVAATKAVQDTLNALSQAVDTRLTAAEAGVQQTSTGLQNTTARVTALENSLRQYNRVTLKPTQGVYAIGETATITATVADVNGQPMNFPAQSRPFVTFVATWGRLRAVPGFDSDAGLGDRTVTVRVNQQGVAQVRLQPDHAEFFDLDFEDDVSSTLNGKVAANNRSAAEIIRTAETPGTARDAGAFGFLTKEYDRADSTRLRDYVDVYYQKYPARVSGKGLVNIRQRWQDFRATVFCFVQNSADVNAPDFGRASAAVQIVYRDWIGPWYNLDYSVNTGPLVQTYRDRLAPKFTGDLKESVDNVKAEVNSIVKNQGVMRKQRDYRLVREALDQVNIAQPPGFLNAVTQSVQNAISIQQTLQTAQDVTADVPDHDVAFEVFTTAATRSDASVASANRAVSEVQKQLGTLQTNLTDAQSKMTNLTNSLTSVGTRLDTALADSGAVGSLRLQVNTLKNQITAFSALNPSDITSKLGAVTELSNRIFQLETRR